MKTCQPQGKAILYFIKVEQQRNSKKSNRNGSTMGETGIVGATKGTASRARGYKLYIKLLKEEQERKI